MVDLIGADLSGLNLASANLWRCDFSDSRLDYVTFDRATIHDASFVLAKGRDTSFRGTYVNNCTLQLADLTDCDLSDATLIDSRLYGAQLHRARFRRTKLYGCDLQRAKLTECDFTGTVLSDVKIHQTALRNVRLQHVRMGGTSFVDTSLLQVFGLNDVIHDSRSYIDLDTIIKSGGLPDTFLRGAGVPEAFIRFITEVTGLPSAFHSCFISYSSLDGTFARRLHADLQTRGVRAWFAPEEMRIGDRIRSRLDESIQGHDKLLLILSHHSVSSSWVASEVETAFELERVEKRDVLFPIRLDDAIFASSAAWAGEIRRTRHIGDFTKADDEIEYERSLSTLIANLQRQRRSA